MCLFKAPKIDTPNVTTQQVVQPEPIAPVPTDNIEMGKGLDTDNETASGVKGDKSKGKGSLRIKRKADDKGGANVKSSNKTGANV